MYNHKISLVLFVTGILFLNSCSAVYRANDPSNSNETSSNNSNAMPEAASAKGVQNQDIRKVDFKNFTYEPACAGAETEKITVKKGEFSREKQEDGYVDRFYFSVFSVSYGDLNGDNSEEAIVLTTCNTGGTGQFTEGFIYTLKDGKPVIYSNIPGGDRAEGGLRSAKVENDQLVVESNDPGPDGGACCPQFVVTTRYDASTGKLKEIGKVEKRSLFPSQRVTFPKGSSGTTINLKIPSEEGKHLIVGAREGQILDVSVDNSKASVQLLEDAQTTQIANGLSATLPKSGDYTIEVTNYEDSPINVTVSIKIR